MDISHDSLLVQQFIIFIVCVNPFISLSLMGDHVTDKSWFLVMRCEPAISPLIWMRKIVGSHRKEAYFMIGKHRELCYNLEHIEDCGDSAQK